MGAEEEKCCGRVSKMEKMNAAAHNKSRASEYMHKPRNVVPAVILAATNFS